MSDRLAEIREWWPPTSLAKARSDEMWLIGEVDRLRAEVVRLTGLVGADTTEKSRGTAEFRGTACEHAFWLNPANPYTTCIHCGEQRDVLTGEPRAQISKELHP